MQKKSKNADARSFDNSLVVFYNHSAVLADIKQPKLLQKLLTLKSYERKSCQHFSVQTRLKRAVNFCLIIYKPFKASLYIYVSKCDSCSKQMNALGMWRERGVIIQTILDFKSIRLKRIISCSFYSEGSYFSIEIRQSILRFNLKT